MRDKVNGFIVQILTFILLCVPGPLYASNYNWIQSDWSGGADTSAVATHPGDQAGWTRFYSKDPYVRTSIPGEASIFPQPASIIQTADLNDFDRGTLTNTLRLVGSGGYVFTTYQETDLSAVVRTGQWFSTTLHNPSGGRYIFSVETGATVTLTFTGTQATWIGPKYNTFGIADVYLDGAFQGSVDLYSSSLQSQQSLFTASGLSNTTHTLRVVVTGRKNSSSSDDAVGVDAFVTAFPNPDAGAYITFAAGTSSFTQTADLLDFDRGTLTNLKLAGNGTYVTTTYEETSPAVVRTGQWFSTTAYGGTTIFSVETGAAVTLTFTGTQATWLGPKYREFGIANVYLDGQLQGSVDLYSFTLQPRQPLFTVSGLSNTSHTLRVVVTGKKNSSALNDAVVVDAFDVVTAYPDVNASLSLDAGFTDGNYESPSFDAGLGGAILHTLTWNAAVPAGSSLKFQIATKNTDVQGPWPDSDFVGPNGTGTYYESFPSTISSVHDRDRYIRYKVFFHRETTDPADSPVLQAVTVNYGLASYLVGNYESPSFDVGPGGAFFKSITWNATVPVGSSLRFQIATNNDNQTWNYEEFPGEPGYGYDYVSPGATINQGHNERRYIRYKAFFERPEIDPAYDPVLNDVTVNFEEIPSLQILISSPYNTEDDTNVINRWKWSEELPAGTDIALQLRTSQNGTAWGQWYGPHSTTFSAAKGISQITVGDKAGFAVGGRVTLTNSANAGQYEVKKITAIDPVNPVITLDSATSYTYASGSPFTDTYTDPDGSEPINPIHRSGYSGNNNDRWLQYRIILFSELGTVTPFFQESRIGYFPASGVYQPDMVIEGNGNNTYGAFGSGAGGGAAKSVDPGFKLQQPLTYDIRVQNDGTSQSVDDTFIISWNTPSDISGDWSVLLNDGNADLTSPASVSLNAGSEKVYTLKVTPSAYAPADSTQDIILNLRSENDYGKTDSVKATTRVNTFYQADGIIEGDGDNQYDPNRGGGGGTSPQKEGGPGDTISYTVVLQNEGNISDRYTLSLLNPPPIGWTVLINDGSQDINITSTAYTTPVMDPLPGSGSVRTYTLKVIPGGPPMDTALILNIYSGGVAGYLDSLTANVRLKGVYRVDGLIYGYGYDSAGMFRNYGSGTGCGTAGSGENIYGAAGSGDGGCAAIDIPAGTTREITVGVQNEGNIPDRYILSWAPPVGWGVAMQERLNDGSTVEYSASPVSIPTAVPGNPSAYNGGEVPSFTFRITPPSTFTTGSRTILFDISSAGDSSRVDSLKAVINSSDTTPPASVVLGISSITATSLKVSWTAPGDDGGSGTAASYDLRYSTSPITEGNFTQTARLGSCKSGESNPGKPKAAGSSESCTVSQLFANTNYYFALKTSDDAGNVSSVSTCSGCPAHTLVSDDTTRPGAITDLVVTDVSKNAMTLCWTAPADDETNSSSGAVTGYDLRYSTRGIVGDSSTPGAGQVTFSTAISATPTGGFLTPKSPGMKECYIVPVENKIDTGGGVIDDRALNTRFYFAVKSLDERGMDADPSVADAHKSLISTGEMMGDGSGDEDGVCETGEACGPARGLTPLVPYAYNMVSVPYHPSPNTPKDVFGDDVGAQLYVYRWDSMGPNFDSGCYSGEPAPYSADPAKYTCSKLTSITEGVGYFLWVPPGNIALDVPAASTQSPAQSCVDDMGLPFQCNVLSLQDGWNMIGAPYDKEINFSSRDINNNSSIENGERGLYIRRTSQSGVIVATFQNAVTARNWIDASVFTYNGVNYTYEVCDQDRRGEPQGIRCSLVMQPWKAYWINVHGGGAQITFELLAPQ